MARKRTSLQSPSLFAEPEGLKPLAERMRPGTLDEIVGQDRLVALGTALRRELEAGRVHSMILWGPPGCGKTTLALLIAKYANAAFESMSAVLGGLPMVREAAERGDSVMVGRDIGTVILPDATLKVYLTAGAEVRAARRAAEMGARERYEAYLAEILERDAADSGRSVAPLRIPDGALVLDTGVMDVEACVEAIVARLEAED